MTSAREKKTLIHHITHRNTIIVIVSSHGHFGLKLAESHASACEVLHIDAEGADCEILESMGELSLIRGPRIIKLETRGLANTLFNPEKEDQTIGLLQWFSCLVLLSYP